MIHMSSHVQKWTHLFPLKSFRGLFVFLVTLPCRPTLNGAYRYDGEHGVSLGVPEQDVDEGDDLQRFAQAHAVGEDAAESGAGAEAFQRFHQVVVQEAEPAHLRGRQRYDWMRSRKMLDFF